MKTLLRIFIACLLAAGSWACSDDDKDKGAVRINGGETFLSLDALARTGKIAVFASSPWRLTVSPEDTWFRFSADNGPAGVTEVGINFEPNDGPARSAVVAFAAGDYILRFELSQSASDTGFDEAGYYFYATIGTLPTLYAGLHVLSHDKPSYVFYLRSSTFDPAQFPPRAAVTTGSGAFATDKEVDRMAVEMKRRVREINAADPTAVFGLYVDDLRCRLGYDWFVAQGIDSARVRVSMLSDGTATYQNFYDYFSNPATAEQNWTTYASEVEALDWNHGGRFPETRGEADLNSFTWPYYLSTRPGYRLVLQNKDLLEPNTGFMGEKLAEMDAENVQPYTLLETLSAAEKDRFYRMASFDYDRFAALFDASPKKNLVIIGTNASALGIEAQQRRYVGMIVDRYGAQYDIFFKPHPADGSSADYEERFAGLTLLPGQMPFEIFVWALLPKLDLIGGYPSTVFLTVPVDKVGFIFAPDAASLVRPLNILFRDAPDDMWIQ